jgi:hypothetical protein
VTASPGIGNRHGQPASDHLVLGFLIAVTEVTALFDTVASMEQSQPLIVQVPRGGEVARQVASQPPPSVERGDVVVEHPATDSEGRLEAIETGQAVLTLPSPEALEREADEVRRVIGRAGTGVEPILLVLETGEELTEEQLQIVLGAAAHTSRAVILRVIADA